MINRAGKIKAIANEVLKDGREMIDAHDPNGGFVMQIGCRLIEALYEDSDRTCLDDPPGPESTFEVSYLTKRSAEPQTWRTKASSMGDAVWRAMAKKRFPIVFVEEIAESQTSKDKELSCMTCKGRGEDYDSILDDDPNDNRTIHKCSECLREFRTEVKPC